MITLSPEQLAGIIADAVSRGIAVALEARPHRSANAERCARYRQSKHVESMSKACHDTETTCKETPSPSLSLSPLSPEPPILSLPHTPTPAAAHVREEPQSKEPKPSKPKKANLANDEDWLKTLEADPTYTGINIRHELGKMQQWCLLKRKQPSRARFLNWIGRAEKTLVTPPQFSFPLSDEQREIATWFGREPDDWTDEERAKWDSLPMVTTDDFEALKWFYRESGYRFLRQTLPALLQNWRGEIDKAKNYDPDKQ